MRWRYLGVSILGKGQQGSEGDCFRRESVHLGLVRDREDVREGTPSPV